MPLEQSTHLRLSSMHSFNPIVDQIYRRQFNSELFILEIHVPALTLRFRSFVSKGLVLASQHLEDLQGSSIVAREELVFKCF